MKSKYNKIFVLLPANYTTGGVELGHQLVDYLAKRSMPVYAVYIYNGGIVPDAEVPEPYRKYRITICNSIEDNAENMIVIPETMQEMAREFHHAQMAFWWMSVDNFTCRYLSASPFQWSKEKSLWRNIKKNVHIALSMLPLASMDILCYFRKNKDRMVHLYQSEYAHQYILTHRLGHCEKLSDYINPDLFPKKAIDRAAKKDIVLYNPAKGYEFTQKIMAACPGIEFVALRGMSRAQLSEIMDKAKLYIDFGSFPGKDRLPREAVLHDCCIITGKLGASAYYEDVPIDEAYKFDVEEKNVPAIEDKIQYVLSNYDAIAGQFDAYREIVAGEQELFYKEIEAIFTEKE